jgi:hypothetical protein
MLEMLKPPAWSPPGADDVDGPLRPRRDAGVQGERAERLREGRDLGRGLALRREGGKEPRLHLVGGLGGGEGGGGLPDLRGSEVAAAGERRRE